MRACSLLLTLAALGCNGIIADPAATSDGGAPPARRSEPVCDPGQPFTSGPSPMRRLTREQYGNAVRDVLGVDARDLIPSLPSDEIVGAFASNNTTLVSRTDLEQYVETSERIVDRLDPSELDDCNRLDTSARECAERYVDAVLPRLFRRAPSSGERAHLLALYDEHGAADHNRGLGVMTRAILVSPSFLHQLEIGVAGTEASGSIGLAPEEVAARLSLLLWNGPPDLALLAAAEAGELSQPDGLRAQAERMLGDPRAARGIESFHRQWLEIDGLESAVKDPELYPEFDAEMAAAMEAETLRFADHVIREGDGSLHTLLTGSFSFPTGPLFELYGLPPGAGDGGPVPLDPTQRHGILTHPSVLTAHAHVTQSSLTLRGKLVREGLLCHDLPDPPPGVDTTIPDIGPGATTREQFQAHVSSPSCAGCHELIDEIGFAFEAYDAIGRHRTHERGLPVDTTGELLETDVDGSFEGVAGLVERLASSEQVERCVATQWFRYGFGRRETPLDGCTLGRMFAALDQNDDLRALIMALVTSDAFRRRAL